MTRLLAALALTAFALAAPAAAEPSQAPAAHLEVVGEQFVLTLPDGKQLTSKDLVGAEFNTEDGVTIRVDSLTPSKEVPSVLLHSFSVKDASGAWTSMCEPDAYGRQAGFPVAGRWDAKGHYVKDPKHWFLTCTSGSQGKCILWGYDPWGKGPHGEDLADFYRACQYTVRANYDGKGEAHTKNGTEIDVADRLGIQKHESLKDPAFAFEAGWGPNGAVCVARTRWPDLLPLHALLKTAPKLGGVCTEETARKKGALIFTRVKLKPEISKPPPL